MIEVRHPGIYNSVQDAGRLGFAKMGIPQAGYMDAYAAELANALANNSGNEAVVEITFGQGQFAFLEAGSFCLTGGDFSPQLNQQPIAMNRLHWAPQGAVLSFGKRQFGARCYLAVPGGIQSEVVLGSRSFSPNLTPMRLSKGDVLHTQKPQSNYRPRHAHVKVDLQHFHTSTLACFPGPEYHQLSTQQKEQLQADFTVSTDNNRVGYRLNETVANTLEPILTAGVIPGTVQLTPSGTLIVLMQDGQVTGGYPRVLQLSEEALAQLSQKMAGDGFRFALEV